MRKFELRFAAGEPAPGVVDEVPFVLHGGDGMAITRIAGTGQLLCHRWPWGKPRGWFSRTF